MRNFLRKANFHTLPCFITGLFFVFSEPRLSFASEQHLSRYSIGSEMIHSTLGNSHLADFEFQYFEGKISQKQQNLSTVEKHLDVLLHYQLALALSGNFALTTSVDSLYRRANREEKSDTSNNNSYWSNSQADPRVMISYKTPTNVYLFVGMGLSYMSKSTLEYDIGPIEGKTEHDATMVHYPILGLTKKASSWQGSIYGILGRETSRKFKTTVSLENETPVVGTEKAYQATTYGLSGKTKISSIDLNIDLKSVQAGEGGPKTEDGITINEDFNQISLEGSYGTAGLKGFLGLAYKSLSYSSNAFMAFDNLPMYRATIGTSLVSGANFFNLGLSYLAGQDTQSLTEFNARYSFVGYSAFCAMNLGF